jgi:integrase/predicted RNA-binding Zn-ribbon protein involved in translation (DUF1610 family)
LTDRALKVEYGEKTKTGYSTNSRIKHCPNCGSERLYKDGVRVLADRGETQRYLCRSCGYRFSKSQSLYYRKHMNLNGKSASRSSSLSAKNLPKAMIALNEAIGKSKIGLAGATKQTFEGKIVEFLWWMKKQGYKETTIISRGSRLRRLVKLNAKLNDPDNVKEIIATQQCWSEARKEAMVYAYDLFAKWQGIKWQRPIYKAVRRLPFIPLEREIDDLIAACNKHLALFLQLAKETGARAGELFRLEWTDIDLESRTVSITAEKGSNPRIFKISNKLLNMLNTIQKQDKKIFSHYLNLNSLRRCFDRQRKRTAHKLGNPRLQKITFHTLRPWKATMEYHKTKDILHVMHTLGHKNIKNTLLYTQLLQFDEKDDAYICKVAKTPKEIQELIEAGFEYICCVDDLRFFRKRK